MKRSKIRLRTKLVHTSMAAWMLSGAGSHPALAATFYVNALSGDDSRVAGDAVSPDTPWKTLSRATAETLAPGDIISVAPGTYNPALGELFPISLPAGVMVVGAGKDQVFLDSDSTGAPPLHAGGSDDFSASLLGMTLTTNTSGQAGIAVDPGLNFSLDISDVAFSTSLFEGIRMGAGGVDAMEIELKISDSDLFATQNGVRLDAVERESFSADLLLENNTISSATGVILSMSSLSGDASGVITAVGNEFSGAVGIRSSISEVEGEVYNELHVANNTFSDQELSIHQEIEHAVGFEPMPSYVRADIENNQFTNITRAYQEGISSMNGRTLDENITIQGNTFTGTGETLISLSLSNSDSFLPVSVKSTRQLLNNQATNGSNFYSDYFDGGQQDVIELSTHISGNTVDTMSHEAFELLHGNFVDQTVVYDEVVIEDNSVSNVDDSSISYLTGVIESSLMDSKLTIARNFVDLSTNDGIFVFYTQFTDCELTRDVLIEDNSISNAQDGGIDFYDLFVFDSEYHDQLKIRSNDVTDVMGQAIAVTRAAFDGGEYDSTISLTDNVISNVESDGISSLDIYISQVSDEHRNLTISNNTISNTVGNGVLISMYSLSSLGASELELNVLQNELSDVTADAIQLGIEIDRESERTFKTQLSGNRVTDPDGNGLDIRLSSSSSVPQPLYVEGNLIQGATEEGIKLNRQYSGGGNGDLWSIRDNQITGGSDLGIHAYAQTFAQPFMLFSGNTITNNVGGIYLSQSSTVSSFELGTFADLGGGPLASPGQNVFQGNTQVETYELYYPIGDNVLFAENNYWNSTLETEVDLTVFDNEERCVPVSGLSADTACDPSTAPYVSLGPVLTSMPTTAAQALLTAELVTDQGGEGPSPGDTFRLTTTLTGTGARGCGQAVFNMTLPEGIQLVAGSVSTTKGSITSTDDGQLLATLGSLSASESILISWEVLAGASESCTPFEVQGRFSCADLPEVLTDDPNQEGDANPTLVEYNIQTFYTDADGDGQGDPNSSVSWCQAGTPEKVVSNALDCDDTSDIRYLGGKEVCDGADNNCDGSTDEGLTSTYYPDADEDGQGDETQAVQACAAPEGFISVSGDCDDDNDAIYTNAPEVCDGDDNDCNGDIDEIGDSVFFEDQDEDGYGNTTQYTIACSAPVGYAEQAGDCNDDDRNVSPGATEICDDVDNDCNGKVDEIDTCSTPTPAPTEEPSPTDAPTDVPNVVLSGGGCSCDASGSESRMPMGMASVLLGAAVLTLLRRRRS